MNLIEIYGLRRSGNHAIIYWLMKNLGDPVPVELHDPARKFRIVQFGDAFFFNDLQAAHTAQAVAFAKAHPIKTLVLSYEDLFSDFSIHLEDQVPCANKTRIFIYRNLENVMASRLKKGLSPGLPPDLQELHQKISDTFFLIWKDHVRQPFTIHFERWLKDRAYRDAVAARLGTANRDLIDEVPNYAAGSSFVGQERDSVDKLLNRSRLVEMDDRIQRKIERTKSDQPRIQILQWAPLDRPVSIDFETFRRLCAIWDMDYHLLRPIRKFSAPALDPFFSIRKLLEFPSTSMVVYLANHVGLRREFDPDAVLPPGRDLGLFTSWGRRDPDVLLIRNTAATRELFQASPGNLRQCLRAKALRSSPWFTELRGRRTYFYRRPSERAAAWARRLWPRLTALAEKPRR